MGRKPFHREATRHIVALIGTDRHARRPVASLSHPETYFYVLTRSSSLSAYLLRFQTRAEGNVYVHKPMAKIAVTAVIPKFVNG